MADNQKIQAFRDKAISQGYSEQVINKFVNAKQAERGEIEGYAQDVASGMPLEYVPSDYRDDVYRSAMPLIRQSGQAELPTTRQEAYDPASDAVLQRSMYKDRIKLKAEDVDEEQKAQEELQNFLEFGGDPTNLSENAKTIARQSGMDIDLAMLDEDREKTKGLADSVNQLMSMYYGQPGPEDDLSSGRLRGAKRRISGFMGRDTDAQVYEDMRGAFAGSLKTVFGEAGQLTNQDVRRIKGAIPSVMSTPEESGKKWSSFFKLLSSQYGIDVTPYLDKIPEDLKGDLEFNTNGGMSINQFDEPNTSELGITDLDEVKQRTGFLGKVADVFVGRSWDTIKTVMDTPKLNEAVSKADELTQQYNDKAREYVEQAKLVTDEKKKKELLEKSRSYSQKAGQATDILNKSIDNYMFNTGVEEDELDMGNLEFAGRRGLGVAGEAAAYLTPGAIGLKGATKAGTVGVAALKGGVSGGLYAATDENIKSAQERIEKTTKGTALGAVVGAALSKPGRQFNDKATDYIPGAKWTKSAVKGIADSAKKWIGGNKEGAINELLQMHKNKATVGKMQQKGINLTKDAEKYIPKIAGSTHEEMLSNTNLLLDDAGNQLNANLRQNGEAINLESLQDKIIKYANDLASGGTKSDKRKAELIIDEAASLFEGLGYEIDPVTANAKKSLFDQVLWGRTGIKRNIKPITAADAQVKDMFSDYVRKALKQDKTIAASLKEYEILKSIQVLLKRAVRGVEGTSGVAESLPTSIGSVVRKVSAPKHTVEYLTKQATSPQILKKIGAGIKKGVEMIPEDVKRSGVIVGSQGGGGLNFSKPMNIENVFSPEGVPLYK